MVDPTQGAVYTLVGEQKANMNGARAQIESVLRARKLDITLTSAVAHHTDDERVAPTEWAALDTPLGGGLRRGHLSEVIGARSSGRSAVFCRIAAAATARGEVVAVIDTHDRFDPASAEAAGVDLGRLLWIRDTGNVERALKAMNLVLQAGGFGIVGFDLADVRSPTLRQLPVTTWMRQSRVIEGSLTVADIVASEHIARSPGGATISLERPGPAIAGDWIGTTVRARRLRGVAIHPRVISARTPTVTS